MGESLQSGLEGKRYPWGDDINPSLANYGPNGEAVLVGSYPANDYGLYDSTGNVWNGVGTTTRSATTLTCQGWTLRAVTSSWKSPRSGSFVAPAEDTRVANRLELVEPAFGFVDAGFRTVQAVQATGQPVLSIEPAGPQQVIISWSPDSPGWILQETTNLQAINWIDRQVFQKVLSP